ncbi:MAG: hypothetical protein ABI199_04245 [Bacteroidia bacterium]
MAQKENPHELILKTLKEKGGMNLKIAENRNAAFEDLKKIAKKTANDLNGKMDSSNIKISVVYKDKGPLEFELAVADDILIFYMHTNIFEFDKSHALWKTSYLKDDASRSYCGIINIYNFLSDSFKYNRTSDVGYMIGRIFINKDSHYFVEGKRQLGFLYNDFVNETIDSTKLENILESAILYCLSFDLLTPPFDTVKEVSVSEMQEVTDNLQIKTGKRLGFRFQADNDQID